MKLINYRDADKQDWWVRRGFEALSQCFGPRMTIRLYRFITIKNEERKS